MSWLSALKLRLRIWRAERACRRDERMCEVCANSFVQDLYAEQVRAPEEEL